jgi:hypothetical protein
MQSPGMQSPGMQSPGMQSPGMQSPGMQSPGMQSPGWQAWGFELAPGRGYPARTRGDPHAGLRNLAGAGPGLGRQRFGPGPCRVRRSRMGRAARASRLPCAGQGVRRTWKGGHCGSGTAVSCDIETGDKYAVSGASPADTRSPARASRPGRPPRAAARPGRLETWSSRSLEHIRYWLAAFSDDEVPSVDMPPALSHTLSM